MTYPPSGSFGQQPDPYGQQPDPYGQQQGGFPQVQYGGLGGGEPPKKNNNAVIATIVVVVVLLAGIGVTGFVAPGFFLSDDKEDKKQTGGTSSTSKSGDNDLQAFAEKLIGAANDYDKSALRDMTCDSAQDRLEPLIDTIDEASDFKLDDVGKPDGDEAELKITFEVDSEKRIFTANVSNDSGDWCWDAIDGDYDDPTTEDTTTDETTTEETTTQGADEGGAAFLDQFLASVASGDEATAQGLMCSDTTSGTDVTAAVAQGAQLTVDASTLEVTEGHVAADMVGTMNGASATGYITAFLEDPGWCVYVFSAYN